MGSIRRLGLIAFRLAMIMTALRIIDTGEVSSVLVCSDIDSKRRKRTFQPFYVLLYESSPNLERCVCRR